MYPSYKRVVGEDYITGTDIKNWVYCPLIVYYRKVVKAPIKISSQQLEGRKFHEEELKRIKRRAGVAIRETKLRIREKIFNMEIVLEDEKLYGTIDLVVVTEDKEVIPVEVKNMQSDKGKSWPDHKYQITYYAILLEKTMRQMVKRGYIYYAPENKLVEIVITNHEKEYVKKIIKEIREMIENEKCPRRKVNPKKCTGGCGYKWICAR